jgi:hypothetical protein
MLIITKKGKPAATLTRTDEGWKLTHFKGCSPVHPGVPGDCETKDIPRFLLSLLPKGPRLTLMQKGRHITEFDLVTTVRQCLSVDNVGDLGIGVPLEAVEEGEELSIEAPVPGALLAKDLNALTLPKVDDALQEILQEKAAVTGIGGSWPKAFLRTQEGYFLIKRYPDFNVLGADVVKAEQGAMRAAKAMGLVEDEGVVVGSVLAVKRFDRGPDGEPYSVCHLADLFQHQDIFQGSFEKALKAIGELGGRKATREFAKQVMFSWVLGDSDHHSENFALIDKGEGWEMSPIYDILPSRFFTGDKEHIALTIDGKKSKLSLKQMVAFGEAAGLEKKETLEFLRNSVRMAKFHVEPAMPESQRHAFRTHLACIALVCSGCEPSEAYRLEKQPKSLGVPLSDIIETMVAAPDVGIA